MENEQIRLNKYIAMCGICSRRDADRLISENRVYVNNTLATTGTKVSSGDEVVFDGKIIKPEDSHVVLAYNKPVGIVCTEKDSHGARTIIEDLDFKRRVTYAGRLDKDSEGLMILTDDGNLIQAMMKGANAHEKEYEVVVDKTITPEFLEGLSKGVYLKDLDKTTRPCRVEQMSDHGFRIILTQGLNRQIRRMCDSFGYEVRMLKRIRIMNIELEDLKYSEHREIKGKSLDKLYELSGLKK